ncbi:MAG TPA: PhoU domain-containing protein [Bacillota bacterium]|nr:PhoU domain-containing protein [Bacillota bacterium]
MLTRQNYYDEKRDKVKSLVIETLDDLTEMKKQYIDYLDSPTPENKDCILETEHYVDKNEKKVEKTIQEIISLQHLDKQEIKWLFTMSRIIREMERIGDQLTNIITISEVADNHDLQPLIHQFFHYEDDMMAWLRSGIEDDDIDDLEKVVHHDEHVNQLNRETYNRLVTLINEKESITESKLKMIIISRFLERLGDHLVNAARIYAKVIETNG